MIFLTLILICTVYLIYRVRRFYSYDIYFKDIPTEYSYPILGNAFKLGFTPTEYLKNLTKWWKNLGYGIFKIDVGPQTLVLVTDPDDVEVILSSTTNISKMDEYRFFWPLIGKGLATTDGAEWHAQRKIITPAFHFNMLKSYLFTINEKSTKFVEVLRDRADGHTFDVQSPANYYAMDVVCETAMGIEMNSMGNHDSAIIKYYHEFAIIIVGRFFGAIKRIDALFRLTDDYKIQTKMMQATQEFNNNIILKRKEFINNKVQENNNVQTELLFKRQQVFLDILLTARIDEKPLTNKQISDEVSTFIFAGQETTASAISFTIYCLSIYPKFQDKIFDELFCKFGNDINRSPTYQEIQDMNYLNMFIKETQRMYTTGPLFGRKLSNAVKLSGHDIPAGTNVIIFAYGMHLNPKVFPDPEAFIPERFSVENRTGRHPYEYVPFSAGPRNCIGQKFAMLEIKSVISAIVRNFVVLPADDINFKPILGAKTNLVSDNGILIRLKPRHYVQEIGKN